jgi:hypothetical protein
MIFINYMYKVQLQLTNSIKIILINFRIPMRPDYASKPFVDQRRRYIFLLISLATGSVISIQ